MSTDLRVTNQSQLLWLRALSAAFRRHQLFEPSVWLSREPEIEDKMLRDADIAEAVNYRCALVAGRQWTLVPDDEAHENAELAVQVGTRLLKQIKQFTASRKLLARAFFHGQRLAFIHGESRTLTIGDGQPRTWWVPTRLEDMDKRELRIVTQPNSTTGEIESRYERWNFARNDWRVLTEADRAHLIIHTYQDERGAMGHGRGLREALAWCWFTKVNVWAEQNRAMERFAGGLPVAKIDGLRDAASRLPNEEVVNKWLDVLNNARARHSLVIDKDDDIEIVNGSAEGWQMFQDAREALRTMVKTAVLSANLTTSADKGGSYALGEIQENSTEALVQFDREVMEETITDSVIACTWWRNWPNMVELGIHDQSPRFNVKQEKKLDPKERADVAKVLNSMGVDLAKDDVYEQTGFRKPQEGEDVLKGMAAPALGGGGPADGLDGFMGLNPPPPEPEPGKPPGKAPKAKAKAKP